MKYIFEETHSNAYVMEVCRLKWDYYDVAIILCHIKGYLLRL